MTSEELLNIVQFFPDLPGVYRYLDSDGDIIYVGKAKNLRKRVSSYARLDTLSNRIRQMVFNARNIIFETTLTEADALILESKLIKEFRPKYNILLKDDKDYSFLVITKTHDYPRILKYRGKEMLKEYRKGPFVSAKALYDIILEITKLFQIRTCTDYTFKTRKRPCIEYFIHQCSAPCVNYISKEDYDEKIKAVYRFLDGKNADVIEDLTKEMYNASNALEYEKAASLRDQIKVLSSYIVQNINLSNTHIVIKASFENTTIIKVFFYNNNINYGTKDFFFNSAEQDVLQSFIKQFYFDFPSPREIWVNEEIEDADVLGTAYKTKIIFVEPKRTKKLLLQECYNSALTSLVVYIEQNLSNEEHLKRIQSIFSLTKIPNRIDIFDNSHFFGKNAFGCVVVFEDGKFKRKDYRAYKIQSANTQDDYQMMREVIERRYLKDDAILPDLLLIDGGLGQFNVVNAMLDSYHLQIDIISIAKGVNRNAFDETFFSRKLKEFKFTKGDKTLFFLERLRDEAHNFAIKSSRKSFEKTFQNSELSSIKDLSSEVIKNLYEHFKDIEEIRHASEEELSKVKGMSYNLAKRLIKYFKDH